MCKNKLLMKYYNKYTISHFDFFYICVRVCKNGLFYFIYLFFHCCYLEMLQHLWSYRILGSFGVLPEGCVFLLLCSYVFLLNLQI